MDLNLLLGEQKYKLTGKQKTAKIKADSEMLVRIGVGKIAIELSGPAANIPSMKNSKLPGKNFANPDFLARVKALDALWWARLGSESFPRFGLGVRVHLLLITAKRAGGFDPIGCLETIQDWLEPFSKKVGRTGRERGWGIGAVENDSQIVGMTMRYDENSIESLRSDRTYIFIQRFSEISDSHNDFIERLKF